jgi:hypothetical protein
MTTIRCATWEHAYAELRLGHTVTIAGMVVTPESIYRSHKW